MASTSHLQRRLLVTIDDMIEEIKIDLGCDVNSLGISDKSISVKIKEALRKVSSYSPMQEIETFPVEGNRVKMPDRTVTVIAVYNHNPSVSTSNPTPANDMDLFSLRKYIYGYQNNLSDPYTYLMQVNQVNTLQNFVSIKDFTYENNSKTLYLSNFNNNTATIHYLRSYVDLTEVTSEQFIQTVKEYALALCKIIEGNIRRKLQGAPGSIQMDGDALVGEGQSEKDRIDSELSDKFKFLRFGIRV